jgi:hypothetical protein
MDLKPKPKDLTPEERLFKIIQEGEKKQDDTLIVSSEKTSSEEQEADVSMPAFKETVSDSPSQHEINIKKAFRAARTAGPDLFKVRSFTGFLSVKNANRTLFATLLSLLFYFLVSQIFLKESIGSDFMKKANFGEAQMAGVPVELFNQTVQIQPETLPKRKVFQPWKPAPPDAAAGQGESGGGAQGQGSLAGMTNLKLSGIYVGEDPEALIEAVDEKKTYTVGVGSEIRGLKVKKVSEEGVVLTDGQSERLLQ